MLTRGTKILVESENETLAVIAQDLTEKLNKATGFGFTWDVSSVRQAPQGTIFLTTQIEENVSDAVERYTLEVLPRAVTVSAATPSGVLDGVQTLRQLFPPEIESDKPVDNIPGWTLPAVRIVDEPRFAWRGLLLDSCRHFLSKDFILRIIDLLAFYKMNVFHWHLTEDQGWRIEIKKYPKLTEIGAYRMDENRARYGGFYTQDDIREVVAHASARGITVIPEIEMPGHSVAALASYPKLSCAGSAIPVAAKWGIFEDVFCAGNDRTFEFIGNVLNEVVDLFPGEYIHVGGDECPRTRWEACSLCKNRMEQEGLKNSDELYHYFVNRVARMLEARGRRMIGWDEVLFPGLTQTAAVQAWRGMDKVASAARTGHDVIASPTSHAYFNYGSNEINLAKVYEFDPVPVDLPSTALDRVLGGECALWTERIQRNLVDKMLLPRLVAFAERLWSMPESASFEDFHRRLQHHYELLERMGFEYGPESES